MGRATDHKEINIWTEGRLLPYLDGFNREMAGKAASYRLGDQPGVSKHRLINNKGFHGDLLAG
jgi:hypothetical protein